MMHPMEGPASSLGRALQIDEEARPPPAP
jgi:hypothetical protein